MKKLKLLLSFCIFCSLCEAQIVDINTGVNFGYSRYKNARNVNYYDLGYKHTAENYYALSCNLMHLNISFLGLVQNLNENKFIIGDYWGLGIKLGKAFYNSDYDIQLVSYNMYTGDSSVTLEPNLIGEDHFLPVIQFDYGLMAQYRVNDEFVVGVNGYAHIDMNEMRNGNSKGDRPFVLGFYGKTDKFMARIDTDINKSDDAYWNVELKKFFKSQKETKYIGLKTSYWKYKFEDSPLKKSYIDFEFVIGMGI